MDLPPIQIVLVRALIGLALLIPFVLYNGRMVRLANRRLQILRTLLSTIAMTGNFFAVAKLPFALFTTVNFTRPLLKMTLAAWLLRERIHRKQWLADAGCPLADPDTDRIVQPNRTVLFHARP